MQDSNRDIAELKKEIVETRNQAIKSDNVVKNLSLDIKSFEKRFGELERRTRLSSAVVHLIVAVVIALAAYGMHTVRVKSLTSSLETTRTEMTAAQEEAAARVASAEKARDLERDKVRNRTDAEKDVLTLLDHLDNGRDKQAVAMLERLDLRTAGPVSERLAGKRITDFRKSVAETSYRNARTQIGAGRTTAGIAELRRSVAVNPEGRFSTPARYLLATNLWTLQKWEDAVAVLREMLDRPKDQELRTEVSFLLGTALARMKKVDEARAVLQKVAAGKTRYVGPAKGYLNALDAGGELPPMPGTRSARASARSVAAPATATTVAP